MTRARRLAAEALGTGLLVTTVVGSGIMAERLPDDVALQLIGNTLPTGAMLVVLISVLGPVSGAHLNPAVTLVLALRRQTAWSDVVPYMLAQVSGGIAGTWLAHLMFAMPVFVLSSTARSGPGQWLAEAVATFGLVTVILAGGAASRPSVAWLVGLYITAAYWFTSSTSFANPAVTVARALTSSFSGIALADVAAFVLAQFAGAVLALGLTRWLLEPPTEGDVR